MTVTLRQALNDTLAAAMAADPAIVVMGEEVAGGAGHRPGSVGGAFGVSRGLYDRFGPDRVIDTPISESALTGLAAGAAATGLRPVIDLMFADFIGVCFDPVLNFLAQAPGLFDLDLPILVRAAYGGGDGSGAQHSQSLHALVAHLPGWTVAMPSTPADAAGLLATGLNHSGPVLFLEHKALYDVAGPAPAGPVPFGRAAVVRSGPALTLVATGLMRHRAEAALARTGLQADLIDLRTAWPLDLESLARSVARTGRLLVVDEGGPVCGLASEVVAKISQHHFQALSAPPRTLTPPRVPVPAAPGLEAQHLPSVAAIAASIQDLAVA